MDNVLNASGVPAWYDAFADWLQMRLKLDPTPIDIKLALTDFVRWHGVKALEEGYLRATRPPMSEVELALFRRKPTSTTKH